MNEEHVAVGASREFLVNAVPEEPVEETVLLAADDDEVGVPSFRDVEQPVDRIAVLGDEVGLDGTRRQGTSRAVEQERRVVGLVGREDRSRSRRERSRPGSDRHAGRDHHLGSCRDGCRPADADDDQLRAERVREFGRASEGAVGAPATVVADDDRVHVSTFTPLAPF